LANCFSYSDDITYLAWDSALVYDKTGSLDVPDLLEFANAQFLELRYYDNALADAIDRSYDELEEANVANKANRVEAYRRIRSRLMEIMADISNIMGNINNALQVTEDIFYARIYTRYLELLKATVWKDNIDYKLNTIQRTYTLMNEEVESYRLERMSLTSAIILAGILLVSIVGLFLK
jgi:valyl-tRNA synthetase